MRALCVDARHPFATLSEHSVNKLKSIDDLMPDNFVTDIENKIREQTNSKMVGFLLGAGSSFLNGDGYPLASQLWEEISKDVPENERQEIQEKMDGGATGIEHALDLLDTGNVNEEPHRYSVVRSMSSHFSTIDAPLDNHRLFVSLLSRREEENPLKVFSLNYDPLIEMAAELECIRLLDGFHGHDNAFFDAGSFRHTSVVRGRNYRGRQVRGVAGSIRLLKLHGSLGWYEDDETGIRRGKFNDPLPATAKHLMIPPQNRKARDTGRAPYSTLWSEFRGSLFHGDDKLNRLITLGYGMADEHVNAEIESALERSNFTLMIITKALSDPVFNKWSTKQRVHIVTEGRCSLNRVLGEGHPDLCSFEGFIARMNTW